MPEGWLWAVATREHDVMAACQRPIEHAATSANAATPAIALCIAALCAKGDV